MPCNDHFFLKKINGGQVRTPGYKKIILMALMSLLIGESTRAQNCGDICDDVFWEEATESKVASSISTANVMARDSYGNTPLHKAVEYGEINHVKAILALGADVNARSIQGGTPLHIAARFSNLETVLLLLNRGADLKAKDVNGKTAIHYASAGVNKEIVLALLNAGMLIDEKTLSGETPLHLASAQNTATLLGAGASVNASDNEGWTPLMRAISAEKMELLLTAGPDVDVRNIYGRTALHYAADDYPSPEVVKMLLNAGADPNIPDVDGWTPLHSAVLWNDQEKILLLLHAGARSMAEDKNGYTPWGLAMESDQLKGTEAYWALSDSRFR